MSDLTSSTALFLGIIEGLTEFLPVSSTGHLILFGSVIDVYGDKAETFDIFVQLGAILAVVVLYFKRFLGLLNFSGPKESFEGWKGIMLLGIACIPAFIVGALFGHKIKEYLFGPTTVAFALIFGGVVMWWAERKTKTVRAETLEGITITQALWVGVWQCAALWPGISRSGSTIVGAMLNGVQRGVAAEFSFLVAVPIMCAAVTFDLLKHISLLDFSDIKIFAIGFVAAFVTAILAIRFFVDILRRFSLVPFAVYRIFLGLLVLVLLR